MFKLDGNAATKRRKHRPMPPVPRTGWTAPKEFPRLSDARALSLDTETYDPELDDHGPGWARGKGHLVGVSLATLDGHQWYFPFGHTFRASENMDRDHVLAFLRDTLSLPMPKIGANLYYDVGWLQWEGVSVQGSLYDVQFAEALLSENDPVNLDHLAEKYLGMHKKTELLYQWSHAMYGGTKGQKQRANIYRSPPSLVGPYAEGDAGLPLRILPKQVARLRELGMIDLFRMECELIPLLIAMRMRGVRIDIARAEKVNTRLKKKVASLQKKLNRYVGVPVNVYAADSLARAFGRMDIDYPVTAKKNPSFTKPFLESCGHELSDRILEIRKLDKLQNVFIEKYLLNNNIDGRVHCQFNSMRSDDFGARSGRLSASLPNLQNIPSRDPVFGPLIRGLFIPDEGHVGWVKQDASQIEFRGFARYARGKNSKMLRRAYKKNPLTDYHKFVQDLIFEITSVELARSATKTINFGIIYGMGRIKLAKQLGLPQRVADRLLLAYMTAIPFAKETLRYYAEYAQRNGYVTTILGRRSLFEFYEPIDNDFVDVVDKMPALRFDQALRAYGSAIKRAMTHKAFNRKVQGTAADILKAGMHQCYVNGLFDEIGVPLLTVHDELDHSDPGGYDHIFAEIRHTCETAVDLGVPIIYDEERGPDWGHVKEVA